jgi:hypothetical protein
MKRMLTNVVFIFFLVSPIFSQKGINMQPVATINGVKVYSDKQVKSIVNTTITFTDHSWCDVATGENVNRGSGYISFNKPSPEMAGEKKSWTKKFQASSVYIRNLSDIDLNIQPGDGSDIEVIASGSDQIIENIITGTDHGQLMIEGKSSGKSSRNRINGITVSNVSGINISQNNSSISVHNGSVIIGMSGNNSSEAELTVKVPKKTGISLSNINGGIVVGDIEGFLQIVTSGGNDVEIGSIADLNATIQGGGEIKVKNVNGNLTAAVQGHGDIIVKDGNINSINATIQGSGDIRIGGKAQDANLSIMGSGDINIDYVKNRPISNILGSGDINVRNW